VGEHLLLYVEVGVTFRCTGVAHEVKDGRRIVCKVRAWLLRGEMHRVLTLVGDEGIDVDEGLHIRIRCGRVGDYRAAVGVPN
jgi:hypothetical protein